MRLTPRERQIIREAGLHHFGVVPYLFGSRLDDAGRGGDIDLYIPGTWSPHETVLRKIRFCAELRRRLGDRKIDVIVGKKEHSAIHDWAARHGEAV